MTDKTLSDALDGHRFAMVATADATGPEAGTWKSRPLALAGQDGGVLSFLVGVDAEWVESLEQEGSPATVTFADPGRNSYVALQGRPAPATTGRGSPSCGTSGPAPTSRARTTRRSGCSRSPSTTASSGTARTAASARSSSSPRPPSAARPGTRATSSSDVLAVTAGALLVVLVGVDVFRTVLLPTSTGSLSRGLSLGLWGLSRAVPGRLRPGARRLSGPLTLVLSVVVWLSGLLLGFALVYWPAVDTLAYTDQYRTSSPGLGEALYLSGTALTTLGFGDVAGGTGLLRALTVLEAAAGLGVLTAALGYLPAIYTLVSDLRTANQAVADLGADRVDGAADLLAVDAVLVLDRVRRDLLAARQHLQRFPVLHHFHPPYDESVVALARGGLGLWVAAHFADGEGRPLPRHAAALEQALRRLTDQLRAHGGGRHGGGDTAVARRLFDRARAASPHERAARDARVDDEKVALLAEVLAVLDAYAVRHAYPTAPAPA